MTRVLSVRCGWPSASVAAAIAVAASLAAVRWGGLTVGFANEVLPGFVVPVVAGLATDRDDDVVDRLVEQIERVRDGDDVSVDTDRDGALGDLSSAVSGLAADLAACRDDREDLTERVESQARELAQLRRLVESASEPMAVLDADGHVDDLNEAMAAFHGTDREDLVGREARSLVSTAGTEPIEAAQRRLLSNPEREWEHVELDLADHTGTERRSEATVGLVRAGDEFAGSVVTIRDSPDRVAADQALDDARDRLEAGTQTLGRLAEIGADVTLSLDEKIQQILDVGRERLGTDGAFLSRIDEAEGTFEFSHTSGTGDLLPPGTVAPMAETYCRKTIGTDDVFEVTNATASGWTGDPAFERWGIETYLGAPVHVGGELLGTLAFADPAPRDGPFPTDQRAFVELASQWIGYELDRARRERELRETKDQLSAVVEASPAALVALDREDRVTVWNPAAERIFGWSESEVLGEPFPLEPPDGGDHERILGRVLAGERLTGIETTRQRKDGEVIDVSLSIAPYRDADGDIAGTMGAIADITERKERERELERTTELLNRTGELADVGGWAAEVTDEGPGDPIWTDTLYDIFGLDSDADPLLAEGFEYLHPDDRERHRAAIQRAVDDGDSWDQELRLVTADGTERWVHTIGEAHVEDGDPVWVSGSMQDVTERKEREEELRETTETLQAMFEASPAAITCITPDGVVTDWNPAAERIFGWSAAEVEGEPIPIIPADKDHEFQAHVDRLLAGETMERVELRRRRKDGTLIDVTVSAATIHDDEGEPVGIVAVIEDVTDQKAAQRQLREREGRLARYKEYTDDVLDAIDDVFYVLDEAGTFRRWNETMPSVTGYDDAAIAEMNALEFFPPSVHERILENLGLVFDEPGSRRVEAPLLTTDGEEIPYEFVASTVENPDGETVLVGVGRDITDRKAREAALGRTTELLEQAQRIAKVGGWEYDVERDELTLTDEFRRLHDIGPDDPVGLEPILDHYHAADRDAVQETFDAAIEFGESYDMEVRLQSADGVTRWVRAIGEPVGDGETTKIRGSVQDITASKEREEAIRTLHDAAQGLLQTETRTEVADLVVETAAAVLDVSGVCLYLLDRDVGMLVAEAATEGYEAVTQGAPSIPVGEEDDPVWNSFATGTRRVFDESERSNGNGPFTEAVGGGLVVPVGDHGVLVVTTADPGVAVQTRQLVETLVATTEAAFDRLASEARLHERDAELEDQNRRLRRQIQLTDVIRRVDRSLVGATSQDEIEAAVCAQLADAEDIAFAWIGRVASGEDRLEPRAWAGTGDTYLDAVSLVVEADATEPAVRTAQSGEPTVVSNVLADVADGGWRKSALDSSFTSALAVPVAFEEYRHGVLAVYADETEAFGDLERTVFAELGQTIANAINAVQTREALHADTLLELTLDVEAPETFLAQVARRADCEVEYVGIGGQSDEQTGVFFATAADVDVAGALDELVVVSEYRLLSESDGRRVFEASVSGPVLPGKLVRHGARPTSITATPAGVRVTVSVPTSTDVREFVEMLGESYEAVELAGRRTVTRATRTRQEMVGDLLDGLTERQLEVLRTAYYAGYFEWPRGSSGEDIAEMLGVTQPTVSRHLRLGQRQLLAQLLEEEPPTVAP